MRILRWPSALVIALLIALAAAGALWMVQRAGRSAPESESAARPKVFYYCPMHPAMTSDRPGDCPICGMRLVLVAAEPDVAAARGHSPRLDAGSAPSADNDRGGARASGESPPGLVPVTIPPAKQALIGARTSEVARVPFRKEIRAVGRVTYDETLLHHIHAKFSGYIERLWANETGTQVRKGQPLLEIYSPEILASQQDYLIALATSRRLAGSTLPSLAAPGEDLVASSRRRLELFDIAKEQIEELERTGEARRAVTLYAPMSGVITSREVTVGEMIEPGTTILDIADLSRVWVIASVYEYELPYIAAGQRAVVTLPYLPDRSFEAKVALIYPALDPATRTVQVRLELPNPNLELKPEMAADVALIADLGPRLAVPDTAVVQTGTRNVVFVASGEGRFEPREVALGLRIPGLYEVTRGLAEREQVLTSGTFYVDSESRLRAEFAGRSERAAPAPAPAAPTPAPGVR